MKVIAYVSLEYPYPDNVEDLGYNFNWNGKEHILPWTIDSLPNKGDVIWLHNFNKKFIPCKDLVWIVSDKIFDFNTKTKQTEVILKIKGAPSLFFKVRNNE